MDGKLASFDGELVHLLQFYCGLLLWLKWCSDDLIMITHDSEMILIEEFRDMMFSEFSFESMNGINRSVVIMLRIPRYYIWIKDYY
jgi:hypothetical protein